MARKLITPIQSPIANSDGTLSQPWEDYFRDLSFKLDGYGREQYFQLQNNQSPAADIEGMVFEPGSISHAAIDYLIQRLTTGTGATEKIESGVFYVNYIPSSGTWNIASAPSTAGITLSITAAGQVQYTSTNLTGTESISKITFRARTLAAKNSLYSEVGR